MGDILMIDDESALVERVSRFLTAIAYAATAAGSGADGFRAKPFQLDELRRRINGSLPWERQKSPEGVTETDPLAPPFRPERFFVPDPRRSRGTLQ